MRNKIKSSKNIFLYRYTLLSLPVNLLRSKVSKLNKGKVSKLNKGKVSKLNKGKVSKLNKGKVSKLVDERK